MGFLHTVLASVLDGLVPQKASPGKPTTIEETVIGQTPDGRWLVEIVMRADSGLTAHWLNYGATLRKLVLPDGTSVVAGFEDPMDYLGEHPFLGSTIGPVANRLRNGSFTIGDHRYTITPEDGPHLLHGGPAGYGRQLWDHHIVETKTGPRLRFSLSSPDRDAGFPSDSWAVTEIGLTDGSVDIDLSARVARPSPLSLTLHPYFNPSGSFDVPIDALTLWSPAFGYSELDTEKLPTGAVIEVAGMTMDLSSHDPVGTRVLDHNFLVGGHGSKRLLATLTDHERYIYVESDLPGFQAYTADAVSDCSALSPRGAVALEPQLPPDLINTPVRHKSLGHLSALSDHERPFRASLSYVFAGPGLPDRVPTP